MIKATTVNGDVVLGLSHENLRRLREGNPILTDLAVLGVECKVFISVVPGSPQLVYSVMPNPAPNRLAVGLPDQHMGLLLKADWLVMNSRQAGAPFDVVVVTGETEQDILDKLDCDGAVITDHRKPIAARMH